MRRLKLLLLCMGLLTLLATPGSAAADANNFIVTSFKADQTLSRNDPQGELRIVERVNVNFMSSNHGLLRAIPSKYKNHSLQIKVNSVTSNSGAPSDYTTYSSNGNTVLKIGDPNRVITGFQEYTIDYTVKNVIGFEQGHDELYWDVNGDQWQQQFQQVEVSLHLPNSLRQTKQPKCFTGSYGETTQNCTIITGDNLVKTSTTQPLYANQTLTYVAGFQKGYFQPSKWYETAGEYVRQALGLILPIVLISGAAALRWWRKGRDPKGRGAIVPQYDAPSGMKPLDVGTITDFKVDNRDITATIINLAINGYIKIVETKKDRLLGKDKLSYELTLVNPDYSELSADETLLMTTLFSGSKAGDVADISKNSSKLYGASELLRKNVRQRLATEGYFRQNPFNTATIWRMLVWALVVVLVFGGAFAALGGWLMAGVVIGALLATPFWLAMDARTTKGVEAKEHILGLKRYLEVAEKTRIEKLQAPNAPYAQNAAEPVKTVELFEKLLPYAIVLGVENQWAEQFKSLYTSPPEWYSGNWSTFSAAYLVGSLSSGMGTAVNTAFSAPSSSSGSGFGGGGFSGGGGGGGGGGGW